MDAAQFDRYLDFLRFPSVSTDPERRGEVRECAQWLSAQLQAMGLEAAVRETGGHPAVVGRNRHRAGRPTVLIYGHYDVQPVDEPERTPGEPLDPNRHWITPPFQPRVENGVVFARGATDNKGQIFAHLSGIKETLARDGDLPVNLVLLIEGEEEVGSEHLEGFLVANREELRCDVIAVSDTGMVAKGWPTFTYGLRGIGAMQVEVTGPSSDLHSGIFGGAVMNPATAVGRLIASLHEPNGRVAIPGFYDGVGPLEDWERESWARLPLNDAELLELTGSPGLFGEPGYTALERVWARPTAEVNGIGGGFQGSGTKTVIPRTAFAKLTFRLVPGQEPETVMARVRAHLESQHIPGVKVELRGGHAGAPYLTDPHSKFGKAAQRALRSAFGTEEVALIREGGSIPIVNTFKKVLGAETLLLGLALPDCRAHAPNENFPVENFWAGVRLNGELLRELAEA